MKTKSQNLVDTEFSVQIPTNTVSLQIAKHLSSYWLSLQFELLLIKAKLMKSLNLLIMLFSYYIFA